MDGPINHSAVEIEPGDTYRQPDGARKTQTLANTRSLEEMGTVSASVKRYRRGNAGTGVGILGRR